MAGKKPVKVYQYTVGRVKGKARYTLINTFENITSVFEKYYDGKKGRLIDHTGFKKLPDDTYVTLEKGGDRLMERVKIAESPYCNMYESKHSDKPFSVYNLKGEKLASFKNKAIYDLITNTTGVAAFKLSKKKYNQGDLTFEYD